MLDLLLKLPEPVLGVVAAGSLWFAFNYAVLGERAMLKDAEMAIMPACIAALDDYQERLLVPDLNISGMLGIPEFRQFEELAQELSRPRIMDAAEKAAKCACAREASASSARFDYAIHTASFRIISPASVTGLRSSTVGLVLSGACGALPTIRNGG
jgi:hypothetical protein